MYKRVTFILTALVLYSSGAFANWQLVSEQSSLYFVSTKKSSISEVNQFKKLSGQVDANGQVRLNINLSSVDSKVPIRDQRLQTMLFDVEKFPDAVITAKVDTSKIKSMTPGETIILPANFTLDLHGVSHNLNSELRVVRLDNDQLLVTPVSPVIIQAARFELSSGIEALKKIVALPSINSAVPVYFSLIFKLV